MLPGPIGAISTVANLAGQKGEFINNLGKDALERGVVAASLYGGSKLGGLIRRPGAAASAASGTSPSQAVLDSIGMGDGGGMANGGGAAAAGRTAVGGWRQALRNVLSGGKPVTAGNVLGRGVNAAANAGGGGLGGALKTGAGVYLSAEALKQAREKRKREQMNLDKSTGIGDELAARARTLFAGSDRLRVPAEDAIVQALAKGRRAPIDTSQFADPLNPYRQAFRGGA